MNSPLIDIARIGIGIIFLLSVALDLKTRTQLFQLMALKKIAFPYLFYVGAEIWKFITAIGLVFNLYTFWAAFFLSLFIFIANMIFNNFWAQPKEKRDFSSWLFLINLAACFGLLAIAGTT